MIIAKDGEVKDAVKISKKEEIEGLTNWKEEIENCADGDKIIYCTLTKEELLEVFDGSYGRSRECFTTAWSEKYVYFPAVYDGAEWVARVLRNPCDEATEHVGGE